MAADGPYGEFYDFYSVSPKYFGCVLVNILEVPRQIFIKVSHFTKICPVGAELIHADRWPERQTWLI
jgi:hypothetical protein